MEYVAAGEAPDAVAVGQAAEAHRALRPPALAAPLGVGGEGEGPVGDEVVGEDDKASEARSDDGIDGGGGGGGEREEADEERAEVCEVCGGGGEEKDGEGVAGDVVEMVGETHQAVSIFLLVVYFGFSLPFFYSWYVFSS
ncbi:hypothetical protein Cni_G06483 [Canna indica]|uniref:Uncharacterized protein n=1 Tax=Canna indica TaxID=4628 RepID=A0AAQ3K1L9_9LILI|nr:hypothetical protein Cni_G06483 [Canna indica]